MHGSMHAHRLCPLWSALVTCLFVFHDSFISFYISVYIVSSAVIPGSPFECLVGARAFAQSAMYHVQCSTVRNDVTLARPACRSATKHRRATKVSSYKWPFFTW